MTAPAQPVRPPLQIPHRERGRGFFPVLCRSFVLLVLLAATWALTALALGIPGAWIRPLEKRLPPMPFSFESSRISYDLFRGILLRDVRLYRKGDVGLAAASADSIRLTVSPLAALAGGDWLQTVWVTGGMLRWPEADGGESRGPVSFGRARFRLELDNCHLFSQQVARASAQASFFANQIRLEQASATIGDRNGARAALRGDLRFDAAASRYHAALTWSGNPSAIESFLQALGKTTAVSVFRAFQPGNRPPNGDMEFEGALGDDWRLTLKASGAARDCVFRGEAFRQVFVNMQVRAASGAPALLTFDPVVLIRDDGLAAGNFSMDFATRDIRFDGYSTCQPATLARLIAPSRAAYAERFQAGGPVRIHAGGTVNIEDFTRNAVTFTFDGEKIGAGVFRADRLSFNARLTGTAVELRDLAGACFGGSFTGSADLAAAWTPDRKMERLQVAVEGGVEQLDGQALALAAGLKNAERYEGRLSLGGRLSGVAGTDPFRALHGEGHLRVAAGRLFKIPVFGPLTDFLERLMPGLDPAGSRTDATADWRVEKGVVRAESITLGGDVFNLTGHGAYALTNSLDFGIQVKLMKDDTLLGKAVRALTLPVSKLFEFRVRGTLGAPRWYPVNFSADLLDKLPFAGRSVRDAEEAGE